MSIRPTIPGISAAPLLKRKCGFVAARSTQQHSWGIGVIHPDTEVREVDPRVGLGVVATRLIPKGTIIWVLDELDQTFTERQVGALHKMLLPTIHKYAFQAGTGLYVLCWDHGRYVNHSCEPNCMAPGLNFEIAIRDIQPGEQLTGDYATYNLESGFECFCGSKDCRRRIEPMDRLRLVGTWDDMVSDAFRLLQKIDQPLWPLVQEKAEIEQAASGRSQIPSCRLHFYERHDQHAS